MAKSTKGARRIVVDDVRYRWRASGNDGWISLTIWPEELSGPTIASSFGYDQRQVPMGQGRIALLGQIVITNRLVRRVITHAVMHHAYDPRVKGKQLSLNQVDRSIDVSDAVRS